MSSTFFMSTYDSFDAEIQTFLGDRLTGVIEIVRGPLAVALTIYLALVGYAVLRGLVDEPWREWFYRILKLSLIWAAASSAGYNEWLVQPLSTDAPNAITQALTGKPSANVGTVFDDYFNKSDDIVTQVDSEAHLYSAINPYRLVIWGAGYVVWLLTGLSAAIGFAIVIFAKLALAIILSLGPIFVALSLFNATRGLFYGFLNQAFNYIILNGVISAIIGIIISLGGSAANEVAASNDKVAGSIIFDIYVVLGTIFFLQGPSIASGIASGAAAGVSDFMRQTLGVNRTAASASRRTMDAARATGRAARNLDRAARGLRAGIRPSNSISA